MDEGQKVITLDGVKEVTVALVAGVDNFLSGLLGGAHTKTGLASLRIVKNAAGLPFVAVLITGKHVGFLSRADAEGLLPTLAKCEQDGAMVGARATVTASDVAAKPVVKLSLAEAGRPLGAQRPEAPPSEAQPLHAQPAPAAPLAQTAPLTQTVPPVQPAPRVQTAAVGATPSAAASSEQRGPDLPPSPAAARYCWSCHSPNNRGALFCSSCGSPLGEGPSAAVPPAGVDGRSHHFARLRFRRKAEVAADLAASPGDQRGKGLPEL